MFTYIINIFVGIVFFYAQSVFAGVTENKVCTSNTGNLDLGTSLISGNLTNIGSGFGYSHTGVYSGFSLVNCSSLVVNDELKVTRKTSYWTIENSNISNNTLNVNGVTYYKLTGTSDPFVNQYGYIYYSVQDTKAGKSVQSLQSKINFYTNAPNESSTQGVYIANIKLYFTNAPVKAISLNHINIGKIYLDVTGTSVQNSTTTVRAIDSTKAYLSFTINPVITKTCSLNSPMVNLPTINTTGLKNISSTAGRTNFTLTAVCNGSLANTALSAIMMDNNNITNTTSILKNGAVNGASNTGVQITSTIDNRVINMNTAFSFGSLNNSAQPTVSKTFYANYYKVDANTTKPGQVSAQAVISLFYK